VIALAQPSATGASSAGSTEADELEKQGHRVLAVAAGAPNAMQLIGLVALSDPPRSDAAALISELKNSRGAHVMVTGDAPATASIVAHAVGLDGRSVLLARFQTMYVPTSSLFSPVSFPRESMTS